MIRQSEEKDIPGLKQLFKVAFDDSEEWIEHFFKTRYKDSVCFIEEEPEKMKGMLYLFPCLLKINGTFSQTFYVYGVATFPEFRQQGIMYHLLNHAYMYAIEHGFSGLFLVPASDYLTGLYEKYLFKKYLPINSLEIKSLKKYISKNVFEKELLDDRINPDKDYAMIRLSRVIRRIL